MSITPRLRMFAGPNGSGKSTLKSVLAPELLGVYLNPDDIEKEIAATGFIDLAGHGVVTIPDEVRMFFERSDLFKKIVRTDNVSPVLSDGALRFPGISSTGYLAAAATDFLRHKLLEQRTSFTFETVMSHPSKVRLLEHARQFGFRTYLYFIATDDPLININRVKRRVALGGHSVPEDRIVDRYHRSLSLLMDAIRLTDRAYIFDNSSDGRDRTWISEITNGNLLEMKTDREPAWFRRAVLDKIAD